MNKLLDKLREIDLSLISCYLMLIFCGLFIQLDITSASGTLHFFLKQFLVALASISFCLIIYLFWQIKWLNIKWIFWFFYLLTLFLLIYVLKHGVDVLGAIRVLPVTVFGKEFSVQPSLLARLVLVILFARVISKQENLIENTSFLPFFYHFSSLIIFSGIYFYLILKENHLSAIITSGFTLISLIFLANFKKYTVGLLILSIFLLGFGVIEFQKDGEFRKDRIKSWLASSLIIRLITGQKTTEGIHPNNRESLLCLTTGKLIGVSPNGGMGKLKYLYEPRTDFVFAIITEEFGLLGALFVILLFMVFVFKSISISSRQDSLFLKLIGYGFSLNIFYNVIIHLGAVTGSLPTSGVTLPFISHGGSSMIVNSMAVGILLILGKTKVKI